MFKNYYKFKFNIISLVNFEIANPNYLRKISVIYFNNFN